MVILITLSASHYNPLKNTILQIINFWNINLQKIPILTKIVFTIIETTKVNTKIIIITFK